MNVTIDVAGQKMGKIPYELLAPFSYFFQECGFQVQWDRNHQIVYLRSPMLEKKIVFFSNQYFNSHPFRNGELELKMINQIQHFLSRSGTNTVIEQGQENIDNADLYIKLALLKIPTSNFNNPVIVLSHNLRADREKWMNHLSNEFRKAGGEISFNKIIKEKEKKLVIEMKYPEMLEESFWSQYGETFSLIISIGIISYFQGDTVLSPLSIIPFDMLQIFSGNQARTIEPEKKVNLVPERKVETNKPEMQKEIKRKEAEVFFDYHLHLVNNDIHKIKIFANLHIKNTGTESLKNPVLCLRIKPAGSVTLSGQILPPQAVETLGVMSDTGSIGWKYMNEDWLEVAEEKGEIWIAPIQQMMISSGQTESLSNIQLSVSTTNIEIIDNILVEAFVYFKEDGLQFSANNRISIST